MNGTVNIGRELLTRDVEFNRTAAIRRAVFDTQNLKEEFYKTIDFSTDEGDWRDKFEDRLDEFIEKKGIHIFEEKPMVCVKDGAYEIVVHYMIGW